MRNPLAEAIELLAKKWAMRIIWELRDGPLKFRELQAACDDASPTIIMRRIKDLSEHHIVESGATEGYQLTSLGEELLEMYQPLKTWANKWQARRNDKRTD